MLFVCVASSLKQRHESEDVSHSLHSLLPEELDSCSGCGGASETKCKASLRRRESGVALAERAHGEGI